AAGSLSRNSDAWLLLVSATTGSCGGRLTSGSPARARSAVLSGLLSGFMIVLSLHELALPSSPEHRRPPAGRGTARDSGPSPGADPRCWRVPARAGRRSPARRGNSSPPP